jgi:hypothetical protein
MHIVKEITLGQVQEFVLVCIVLKKDSV